MKMVVISMAEEMAPEEEMAITTLRATSEANQWILGSRKAQVRCRIMDHERCVGHCCFHVRKMRTNGVWMEWWTSFRGSVSRGVLQPQASAISEADFSGVMLLRWVLILVWSPFQTGHLSPIIGDVLINIPRELRFILIILDRQLILNVCTFEPLICCFLVAKDLLSLLCSLPVFHSLLRVRIVVPLDDLLPVCRRAGQLPRSELWLTAASRSRRLLHSATTKL